MLGIYRQTHLDISWMQPNRMQSSEDACKLLASYWRPNSNNWEWHFTVDYGPALQWMNEARIVACFVVYVKVCKVFLKQHKLSLQYVCFCTHVTVTHQGTMHDVHAFGWVKLSWDSWQMLRYPSNRLASASLLFRVLTLVFLEKKSMYC